MLKKTRNKISTSEIHLPFDTLKAPVWQLADLMPDDSFHPQWFAASALQPDTYTTVIPFCNVIMLYYEVAEM